MGARLLRPFGSRYGNHDRLGRAALANAERRLRGPDEMRRKVRELVRAGADVIKCATSGGVLSTRSNPHHAHFGMDELEVMVEMAGDGEAGGLAWAVTLSVMDFLPRHSFGINYARTEAGWLLSPQYTPNEELYEARYVYRPTDRISLDVRGRWRYDIRERLIDIPDRKNFDFYARATWSFGM